jgi:hypothetical protein
MWKSPGGKDLFNRFTTGAFGFAFGLERLLLRAALDKRAARGMSVIRGR